MLHARNDYNHIQDPKGKIAHDEPVFLLRAKDKLAPEILNKWADYLEAEGGQPEMIETVRLHADKMIDWQEDNGCKLPDM